MYITETSGYIEGKETILSKKGWGFAIGLGRRRGLRPKNRTGRSVTAKGGSGRRRLGRTGNYITRTASSSTTTTTTASSSTSSMRGRDDDNIANQCNA